MSSLAQDWRERELAAWGGEGGGWGGKRGGTGSQAEAGSEDSKGEGREAMKSEAAGLQLNQFGAKNSALPLLPPQ